MRRRESGVRCLIGLSPILGNLADRACAPTARGSMGDLLSFHLKDVEVDRASSGPDALELLSRSCTYDAVITDIKMPIMDGLTLMAKICERRPNLPTLLLTGHGDRDIGVKALKSGAYAYMPKPVDRDYFLAWVQRAIHLSQLNRQIQEQIALERQRSQELAQVVLALRDSERRFLYWSK